MTQEPIIPTPFHPSTRPYRFVILVFNAFPTFGSYFAYGIIGVVAPSLVQQLGAGRETVGKLHTMHSITAILSVLIGGILIDRLGMRRECLSRHWCRSTINRRACLVELVSNNSSTHTFIFQDLGRDLLHLNPVFGIGLQNFPYHVKCIH